MSVLERQQAALAAIKEIETRFGVRVVAVLQSEQFNVGAAMVKAAMSIEPIAGWVAPS